MTANWRLFHSVIHRILFEWGVVSNLQLSTRGKICFSASGEVLGFNRRTHGYVKTFPAKT